MEPEGPSSIKQQGARYLIVGGSSALVELMLFQGLYAMLQMDVVVANVCAVVASTAFNFLLNRTLTFKSASNPARSVLLYLLLLALNTCFTSTAIALLVSMGTPSVAAKLLTMACVTLWNFVLYRKVVFV